MPGHGYFTNEIQVGTDVVSPEDAARIAREEALKELEPDKEPKEPEPPQE